VQALYMTCGVLVSIMLYITISQSKRILNGFGPVQLVKDNAMVISRGEGAYTLVPPRCESELRGQFDKIYLNGGWGPSLRNASVFYGNAANELSKDRIKSASGRGSDLGPATMNSLRIIREAIVEYNVLSMVDIPCGDVNWILDSLETDTLPLYIGLDIAGGPIGVNNELFAHHINKQFHFWDASACPLPRFINSTTNGNEQVSFDLVHVRDVIQHMPLKLGVQFFCNVFAATPKVLVTTTYPDATSNGNIKDEGKWYKNNLFLEPFLFPKTDKCERTHGPGFESDHTCVFDLVKEKTWVDEYIQTKC